jgi:hypothetical protein
MLAGLTLTPGDRVLFIGIPEPALLAEFAAVVTRGIVVAIGPPEQVWEARAACAHLENVMAAPGTADEIPWQENFFSWVVHTRPPGTLDALAAREIFRVLTPGGAAWLPGPDAAPLIQAGLLEASSGDAYRVLRKPSDSMPRPPNGMG